MRLQIPLAALVVLLAAPVLAEEIDWQEALVVGRASADAAWTDGPTEARPEDGAELSVVLRGKTVGRRPRTVYLADEALEPLSIGGRAVAASRRRPWSAAGRTAVRWSYVEPHAWRPAGEVAPNGSPTPYYSNVVAGGPDHGEWLGYDRVLYYETPIGDWSDEPAARRRAASARPPLAEDDLYGGLGTMRYRVEVRLDDADGRVIASPGAEAVDDRGIKNSVHRVSIRHDDSFLGYLTSYFLVPEVFGSAGRGAAHQTDRFVGADCADVLVGALHAQGHRDVEYLSVSALPQIADLVAGPVDLDENGVPVEGSLEGVEAGDVIRIDYGGVYSGSTPRSWDHVAVLYEDLSDPEGPLAGAADGRLDGFDRVVHMGHPRLQVEPLADQVPARVDVLRWDEARLD